MRIVAGEFGSRRLTAPRGATRPTSDRARESLFATLGSVEGDACLDLFAGTGALGLEALSRGAASCVFCEIDPAARRALEANIAALGVGPRCRVRPVDARRLLRADAREGRRYDLVLVDPPYAAAAAFVPELRLRLPAVLTADGRVALETAAREEVALEGFEVLSDRRVGAARLTVLRASPTEVR
ncbi:MAG: 16S rRNA (guanine(966)-N(2))-methyltransferase [uncultured Thermoleophilia bacterium]|uniref:16S rRNA (Guanine(966)-N(2))-methyltransferase n=1 Tax=uncultured Thermoleophilia bacterium TaxID=1497501 RepID=A0A6J4TZJ7_9ACTN|nr:MAG: 16S rRNA (guanine(966)-N(2))-methyltransferase [uncultured Thermoleophilia bacterium]